MSKAPAFQFYANDFMDATSTWEANAVGLYIRCLCKQWTHGSIPADLRILARAIHCDRSELESVWSVLAPKFEDQGDGTLKNRRLELVRDRQKSVSEARSEAGKRGAIAKANAKANASTKDKQRKVKEKVEGEEEGNSEKERASAKQPDPLPFPSPAFAEAVARWERHRAEIKHRMTPETRKAWLKKCQELGEARSIAAIDHSIANGWQGMFEAKASASPAPAPHQTAQRRDLITDWDYKKNRA